MGVPAKYDSRISRVPAAQRAWACSVVPVTGGEVGRLWGGECLPIRIDLDDGDRITCVDGWVTVYRVWIENQQNLCHDRSPVSFRIDCASSNWSLLVVTIPSRTVTQLSRRTAQGRGYLLSIGGLRFCSIAAQGVRQLGFVHLRTPLDIALPCLVVELIVGGASGPRVRSLAATALR